MATTCGAGVGFGPEEPRRRYLAVRSVCLIFRFNGIELIVSGSWKGTCSRGKGTKEWVVS